MTKLVLVGFGGFLGTILRFLVYQSKLHHFFPFQTLGINLFGSLLIGAMISSPYTRTNSDLYQVLVIGVIGGFTTYSAFSGETLELIFKSELQAALLYVLGTVLGGLLFCTAGFFIGKVLWE